MTIRAVDLVRHAAYQTELLRLMYALTNEDANGNITAAFDERTATSMAVLFRRRHGLLIDDAIDPIVYLIGIHRALIRHKTLQARSADGDMTARGKINYSEHWLIRNGHRCAVDELFNPKPEQSRDDDARGRADAGASERRKE